MFDVIVRTLHVMVLAQQLVAINKAYRADPDQQRHSRQEQSKSMKTAS
jgi:hypothetical protein